MRAVRRGSRILASGFRAAALLLLTSAQAAPADAAGWKECLAAVDARFEAAVAAGGEEGARAGDVAHEAGTACLDADFTSCLEAAWPEDCLAGLASSWETEMRRVRAGLTATIPGGGFTPRIYARSMQRLVEGERSRCRDFILVLPGGACRASQAGADLQLARMLDRMRRSAAADGR